MSLDFIICYGSPHNYDIYFEADHFYLFVLLVFTIFIYFFYEFFTNSVTKTDFQSQPNKNFHKQRVYMKIDESQIGVALLQELFACDERLWSEAAVQYC